MHKNMKVCSTRLCWKGMRLSKKFVWQSGSSNEAPAGFKTREGWPLSWLQKSRAEKP